MKMLTVFTPTYNRAHTLHRCYESLCRQSSNDFIWLIIDDGSQDETKSLVTQWQLDNTKFKILYYYKENGGLHTAYNEAIYYMKTELAVCIDSDDAMSDDAVSLIINTWNTLLESEKKIYGGLIGLDISLGGKRLSPDLPCVNSVHLYELADKYHFTGDTKMVHRVDLLKKVYPQPTFKNEKNFNPIYLFKEIDKEYSLLVLNEVLAVIEYQSDGMTASIFRQYVNSPNSFVALRKQILSDHRISTKTYIKQFIHFVSNCMLANRYDYLSSTKFLISSFCLYPLGLLLYFFTKYKASR